MNKTDLHQEFISSLHDKIPQRAELVKEVSRILRIEKEPVSRRLNGNVNFSINEMGKLARELDISVDHMLFKDQQHHWVPFIMEMPWTEYSMDALADSIEESLRTMRQINNGNCQFGYVFGSLPLDFFAVYPTLFRFFLFKWGYFFIDTEEFSDFTRWEVPPRFTAIRDNLENPFIGEGKVTYIWDSSLIYNLAKELKYLCDLSIIDAEGERLIAGEIHSMLSDFEIYIKNITDHIPDSLHVDIYISNIPIGVNSWSIVSEAGHAAFFETRFTRSPVSRDPKSFSVIKQWICSLKKVSYLVSGSGEKERRLFFKDQHEIMDTVLA